jgi:alanine racemase
MVRTGLLLYGLTPTGCREFSINLRPAMTGTDEMYMDHGTSHHFTVADIFLSNKNKEDKNV